MAHRPTVVSRAQPTVLPAPTTLSYTNTLPPAPAIYQPERTVITPSILPTPSVNVLPTPSILPTPVPAPVAKDDDYQLVYVAKQFVKTPAGQAGSSEDNTKLVARLDDLEKLIKTLTT